MSSRDLAQQVADLTAQVKQLTNAAESTTPKVYRQYYCSYCYSMFGTEEQRRTDGHVCTDEVEALKVQKQEAEAKFWQNEFEPGIKVEQYTNITTEDGGTTFPIRVEEIKAMEAAKIEKRQRSLAAHDQSRRKSK